MMDNTSKNWRILLKQSFTTHMPSMMDKQHIQIWKVLKESSSPVNGEGNTLLVVMVSVVA